MAEERIRSPFGMGHHPQNIPLTVHDPRNVAHRTVRVGFRRHLPVRITAQAQGQRRFLVQPIDALGELLPAREAEPPTSFRWVGLETWRGWDGLLGMNRAASVREFESALEAFAVPAQNVVVADTAGRVGYFCAGRFPRRPWAEAMPPFLDGSRPEHAWGGYLSWAEHPRAVDPADGYIVTANNRVAKALPPSLARAPAGAGPIRLSL